MSSHPFGLRENPFGAGHDPRLVYAAPERQEILDALNRAIGSGEPFVVVTGDAGTGKTSLLSEARTDWEPRASIAYVANPSLSRAELLEEICLRFGIALPRSPTKPQALARLEQHLTEVGGRDQSAVLIVDEAHDLSPELLEEIRLLSNSAEGRAFLQVVLAGLPELEIRLARPECEQLRQRIAFHGRLNPLSADDTGRYIHHRVSAAGGDAATLFPPETCEEIHRQARGIPRAINTLAGQAMQNAAGQSADAVTPEHVQAAADSWLQTVTDAPAVEPQISSAPPRDTRPKRPGKNAPLPAGSTAPSTFQLPTEPSETLDPDARAWVSRFIGSEGLSRIGGRLIAPTAKASGEPPGDVHEDLTEVIESAEEPLIIPEIYRVAPVRPPRTRPRNDTTTWIAAAAVLVLIAAIVVLLLPRPADERDGSRARVASGPRISVEKPSDPGGTGPAVATVRAPAPATAAVKASAPIQASASPAAGTIRPPADADSAASTGRPRQLGLEVASYLLSDRAKEERDRLAAATGLPSRVVNAWEDGTAVYRIVLGPFRDRRSAERAADDLLGRGVVGQARVIPLAGRDVPLP